LLFDVRCAEGQVNYDVEVGQFCCLVLVVLRDNYDVEQGQM